MVSGIPLAFEEWATSILACSLLFSPPPQRAEETRMEHILNNAELERAQCGQGHRKAPA
jgi:hypothetical protein